MDELVLETTIKNEVEELRLAAIVVKSQEDRESVSKAVTNARYIRSRVETFFKPLKEDARKPWKRLCDLENSYTTECDEFEKAANKAILAYDDEVRKEQERLAAEAEKKRQAEEAARIEADAARALAEDGEDNSTPEARQEAIREAEELERKAQVQREEAAAIERGRAAMAVRKESGESIRITMKARVVDIEKVPRFYMILNQSMLDAIAKANKDQIKAGQFKIEGIEFFEDKVIVRKAGW